MVDQETADLIYSLHAKKLALLFYGRRDEFLKFMSDAHDNANEISEDQVLEEFEAISIQISFIEKKLASNMVQLISFAP